MQIFYTTQRLNATDTSLLATPPIFWSEIKHEPQHRHQLPTNPIEDSLPRVCSTFTATFAHNISILHRKKSFTTKLHHMLLNFLQTHVRVLFKPMTMKYRTQNILYWIILFLLFLPGNYADTALHEPSKTGLKVHESVPPEQSVESFEHAQENGIEFSGELLDSKSFLKEIPFEESDENQLNTEFDNLEFQKGTLIVQTHLRSADDNAVFFEDMVSAKLFSDNEHTNFNQMLYIPQHKSLYVVAQGASLLKIDTESLLLQDVYTIPEQLHSSPNCDRSRGCEQVKEINLLAAMPGGNLVWYCALYYEQHHSRLNGHQQVHTGCAVPKPENLGENLLQWENSHFTSMDPERPPVVVNSQEPFTYIAGVSPDYLRIIRTHMPDWTAKMNWQDVLFSQERSAYVYEPARMIMGFESQTAVYYLLRENTDKKRDNDDFRISDSGAAEVSRLVRICKGDRGGLKHIADVYFGTLAKADLVCQVEIVKRRSKSSFAFTRVIAAHWDLDARRLYATFSAGIAAPLGSAVCIYDLQGIESAFNGPVISIGSTGGSFRKNPFPNICERFTEGNLTNDELSLGRIGASYMRRYWSVNPLFGHAVASVNGKLWTYITGYQINLRLTEGPTTILWLATKHDLLQLAVYEEASMLSMPAASLIGTCELRSIQIKNRNPNDLQRFFTKNQKTRKKSLAKDSSKKQWKSLSNETVSSTAGSRPEANIFSDEEIINDVILEDNKLFVATTHSVYQVPTAVCREYNDKETCLSSHDPHCAWHLPTQLCFSHLDTPNQLYPPETIKNSINQFNGRPVLQCPPIRPRLKPYDHTGWSNWNTCHVTSLSNKVVRTQASPFGSCQCRICLSDVLCNFGEQQVAQCQVIGIWSPWSDWSECRGWLRSRERFCLDPFPQTRTKTMCVGELKEEEKCIPSSMDINPPEEVQNSHLMASKQDRFLSIHKSAWIGASLGMLIGIVCMGLFGFLFIRVCKEKPKLRSETIQPLILNRPDATDLESQIRETLLPDYSIHDQFQPLQTRHQILYASPRHLHMATYSDATSISGYTSQPRYNYLPNQTTIATNISNYDVISVYDRLEGASLSDK